MLSKTHTSIQTSTWRTLCRVLPSGSPVVTATLAQSRLLHGSFWPVSDPSTTSLQQSQVSHYKILYNNRILDLAIVSSTSNYNAALFFLYKSLLY